MKEDLFSVYVSPLGAVYVKDSQSPDVNTITLYVSYSENKGQPGPVNAEEYARAIVAVLNAAPDDGVVAATLHKV